MQTDHYRLALILVIASSVANSGNGLIVRSMDSAGDWQIIFYRSCFLATALGTFFVVRNGWRVRAALRELRPWALFGSLAIAIVNTCFILAMTRTTVANTMDSCSSAAPFASLRLIGWILITPMLFTGPWQRCGSRLLSSFQLSLSSRMRCREFSMVQWPRLMRSSLWARCAHAPAACRPRWVAMSPCALAAGAANEEGLPDAGEQEIVVERVVVQISAVPSVIAVGLESRAGRFASSWNHSRMSLSTLGHEHGGQRSA